MGAVTFREALELIECLTEEERRDLIEIVRRCLVEEWRGNIAKSIHAARREFARGEVKRGTVEDLVGGLPARGDCFELRAKWDVVSERLTGAWRRLVAWRTVGEPNTALPGWR